jgi:predicted small lipoprotein YifL
MRPKRQARVPSAVLAIAGLLIVGCGQKGALYLPTPPPDRATTSGPAANGQGEEDARERRDADER